MENFREYVNSLQISDIPWDRLLTAYGTAYRFPVLLELIEAMDNIGCMKKALEDIAEFEHQSTFFPPAPFALLFLKRIKKKAESTDTPEAKWLAEQLAVKLEWFYSLCFEAECMEHADPLPYFSDLLDEKYLLPENCTDDDIDAFCEDENAMPDDYFYSLYYYSKKIIKLNL